MGTQLQEFRNNLVETLSKNQEDFEKQLIYVSAGALGASIFFIEKIVKDIDNSHYKWLLILSWFFLGSTIVINAISHYIAMEMNYKSIDEIDKNKYDEKASLKRNRKLKYINLSTLVTLLIGIFFLILFTSINLHMSDTNKNTETPKLPPTINMVLPDVGEKLARTSTPPPPPPKPISPTNSGKKE
jgi:quinol-cytochrome oxidoreductase complex cytochrome b subunit